MYTKDGRMLRRYDEIGNLSEKGQFDEFGEQVYSQEGLFLKTYNKNKEFDPQGEYSQSGRKLFKN
jgi:hypothetical protein